MMGWYDDGSVGAGDWIAMIVMMSLFWGAVIYAGVVLFRGVDRRSGSDGRTDRPTYRDPVDILDERFARGELENEEYEARKAVLRGTKR